VSTLKEICKEQTELLNECRQNIKELTEENEKLQENNEQLVENNDKLNEIFSYQENKKKELRKEREKLNDKLNQAYEDGYQMEGKYRDMKTQRDTLIDDIAVLRGNNERYRNRAENAMEYAERSQCEVLRLERENEQLKESHIKHITNMENYYKDRLQKLKEKNGELQEVIESKNSDLLFTEDENEQLKQGLLRTEEFQDEIIQLEKDFENKHNLLSEFSQHIGNKPSSSTYKYFRAKLDDLNITEDEQND